MFEQLFNSPFLYSLSLTLVHFLWQGLLVAFILKSVLSIVDKNKPKVRYALASLAMLANAILAMLTFYMVYPDTNSGINSNLSPIPLTSLVNELTQHNTLLTYQELLPSILAYSLPYIALLWLATITTLAFKLLIEIRNVNNLPMNASVSPSSELLLRFDELAKQIKLTKTPKLLISLKAEVPMAIGWLKPVVLLPASMVTGLDSSQLEMLILHELAHIRRHDYFVNFLQTLIELLFFFHPSVHWIGKQMRNEREYCSDDIAVQHCGDAIAYAHTLTDTASLCAKGHLHTIPTMAMAASGGDLKARVLRLVDHHCAPTNSTSKWLAAISLLLALTLLCINQVLTMPFAQQLNNQFPWQNSYIESKNIFKDEAATTKQKSMEVDQLTATLTNDSIALQLLQRDSTVTRSTKILSNEIALAAAIIEPLTLDNHLTPPKGEVQKSTLVEQSKSNKKEQVTIVDSNQTPTTLALQESITSAIKTKLIITKEKSQALIEEQKSTVILQKSQTISPLIAAVGFTKPSQVKAELAELQGSYNDITQLSTTYDKDLEIKATPYQQLSYRKEINKLAIKNERYQASHAINMDYNKNSIINEKQLTSKETVVSPLSLDAKLLNVINPKYPSLAKRRGIEMEVKVSFTIDRDGKVKDINFVPQSKLTYFKSSIRTAIRKWRFSPATINDRNVESKMSKIFSFSLQHKNNT